MHFLLFSIPLAFLAVPSQSWAVSLGRGSEELVSCLQSSLSPQGSVVAPGYSLFMNDTRRFSTLNVPSFKVVSRVSNEEDVRASISCAKNTGTPFLFTGPRHGYYTGFTKLQNGLEILTTAFNEIKPDPGSNTMTVGGAANFQDVVNALYAVKKNIPVGSGPCVGIVGASMGSGIGRLEGLYGLIIDSLLSVRIMLPNTTVVEASAETNPDLFWGIRGAGVNFGFVLNATYRVYDEVPNGQHFSADFELPYTASRAFYQALKEEGPKMQAPLCITTTLQWVPKRNDTSLLVNAVYAGPESEGREAVRFLQEIRPIIRQNFTVLPWNEITQNTFFNLGNEAILNCDLSYGKRAVFGAAFNQIDVEAHVNMTEQFNYMVTKYPQMRASDNSMYFCATQAVRAVSDDATAYAWRGAQGHQTWGFEYGNTNTTDAAIEHLPQKMRATIAATAGSEDDGDGGLNVYVGFSNGDEPVEAVFSRRKLPRLASLKREIDPDGLFDAYHPLPTRWP